MRKFHVKAVCTTDDPCDDLRWHEKIAADQAMEIKVLPAFRPDKAVNIEKDGFAEYIGRLSQATGKEICCTEDVIAALYQRIGYFSSHGCLCADHGLDYCMYAEPDKAVADKAFQMAMEGKRPPKEEADAYKTMVTIACAKKYAEKNWVMQIHFGCLRDNNKPQFGKLYLFPLNLNVPFCLVTFSVALLILKLRKPRFITLFNSAKEILIGDIQITQRGLQCCCIHILQP